MTSYRPEDPAEKQANSWLDFDEIEQPVRSRPYRRPKVTTDRLSEAIYVRFRPGRDVSTKETTVVCNVDRGPGGEVVGIEILGPGSRRPPNPYLKQEPQGVQWGMWLSIAVMVLTMVAGLTWAVIKQGGITW